MYIPRTFRMPPDESLRFMKEHPFAILISTSSTGEPTATHLPLIIAGEGRIVGHMARANPHWRQLDGARVLAVFTGPHAYIAPQWYGSMPNVPTWNYLTVHVSGTCRVLPEGPQTLELLQGLSRFMEPDSPIPDALENPNHRDHAFYMAEVPAIVGFEIVVDRIEGKAKLGQNRPRADREGAASGLSDQGGEHATAIAEYMRKTVTDRPDD